MNMIRIGVLLGVAVCVSAEGAALRWSVREARPGKPSARQFDVPAERLEVDRGMVGSATLERLGGGQRADLVVRDMSGSPREIVAEFHLTLPGRLTHVFVTDGQGPQQLGASGSAVYRAPLALPAVTFFGPEAGVTIAAPLEIPAPSLSFSWQRTKQGVEVAISVAHLRLPARGSARTGLLVREHAGCWRPGLGWLVDRYPEYFHPPLAKVFDYDGPMIYDFVTPESRLRRDLGQDLKWQELGWYWPHLGLYRPDTDRWRRQPGSEGGLGQGGEVTVPMLNDFIALGNRLGIGQCLYFQSTESWGDYAERRFPESRVRSASGALSPTWIKCVVMNPSPDGPFGRHIVDQARRLVETFPGMAGVFWDQNCYTGFDFAHDDGISMVDGRPVSMLEFPQHQVLRLAGGFLHEHGKVIFTNGGWTAGLARYCDGHMSEGTGPTRRLQYLCMMKHLTLLCYDGTLAGGKEKVKLALETGSQPSVTLGNDACREFFQSCRPIFRLLRRKQWVFEPRALTLPDGIGGNIFRNGEGNYVVTAVIDDTRPPRFAARQQPTAVAARLADGQEVRQAFTWRPDLAGFRQADLQPGPDRLTAAMPYPDWCGALVLARRGRWISGQRAELVEGRAQPVGVVLANLSDRPWDGRWTITVAGRTRSCELTIPPWGSKTLAIEAVEVPRDVTKLAILVQGPQPDGSSGPATVELPVASTLSVAIDRPPAQLIEGEPVSYVLVNRSRSALAVNVKKTWTGRSTIEESAQLMLKPGESRILDAAANVPQSGRWTLKIDAQSPERRATATVAVDVAAVRLPEGFHVDDVQQLTLQMDVFNSLGGRWEEKPVVVQGVTIGRLPVTGSTLKWHEGMQIGAAGDTARTIVRQALEPSGAIRLAPTVGNEVKNCFKVRNVRAALRLRSGELILSTISRDVHCATGGWLYAEGDCVALGRPVPLGTLEFLPRKTAAGGPR